MRELKFGIILFSLFIIGYNEVTSVNTDQWLGTKLLDKNYLLFWKKDDIKEELIVRVEVRTKGWVGFGFSMYGLMEKSDLVIGWITPDGKTQFQDRWTDRKAMPVIDMSQDWTLSHSMQNSSHTVLQFHRPYKTCDSIEDIEILETEHQNIIWAYSLTPPISDQDIGIHDFRGVQHIRLLDPVINIEPKEDDLELFEFKIENITIPKDPMSMVCKLVKLPYLKPRHIVKCGPHSVPSEMQRFVHHTVLLNFDPIYPDILDQYVGQVFTGLSRCQNQPDILRTTMHTVFHPCQHTYKDDPFYTPPDGGIKVSDSPFTSYYMMEIHLQNPRAEDAVVTQSMQIWTTAKLRKNDLDLFDFVAGINKGYAGFGTFIPPRVPRYAMKFVSSTYCFEEGMSDNGFNVDSIAVHTHNFGREFYIQHFRGDRELEPLIRNRYYDFKFEVFQKMNNHVTILPGDKIVTTCVYNSTTTDHFIDGGYGEMCLAQMIYWPPVKRRNNTYYGTDIDKYHNVRYQDRELATSFQYESILEVTNLEQIDGYYDGDEPVIRKPVKYNGTKLIVYLNNKKEWIPIREMERILSGSDQMQFCGTGEIPIKPLKDRMPIEMPKNYKPYQEKYRQCKTPSC